MAKEGKRLLDTVKASLSMLTGYSTCPRIYSSVTDIKKVRDGFGMSIISTSKGLMTNSEARKAGLGGEILIQIY